MLLQGSESELRKRSTKLQIRHTDNMARGRPPMGGCYEVKYRSTESLDLLAGL